MLLLMHINPCNPVPPMDYLKNKYPLLGAALPKLSLSTLPTPVNSLAINTGAGSHKLAIKFDNLTGQLYGGNKIRKLEYIFAHAIKKQCESVATFGAVGSNHALATALYARHLNVDCTCFLSHQVKTSQVPTVLNKHVQNKTRLVRFGGSYKTRLATLRENLRGQRTWVIPMGGSSWLGNIGFVAAGLELAQQIESGDVEKPDRIYVGCGTMGTAVGIALGLAAADLNIEIHAIRVSDKSITNRQDFDRLLRKTAVIMRQLDNAVPAQLASRTNVTIRDEFFGPGYAQFTAETERAIKIAKEQLGLTLECTYTGKAMAALLADLKNSDSNKRKVLYWHTYNSVPINIPGDQPLDTKAIPAEFLKYFDDSPV